MMQETVPLPDPAVQRLVHPDDVPAACELWRRAWQFSLLGSGGVLFLLGAALWALTGGWPAPTLAVLSTGAVAWFSHDRLTRAAWEHIPRSRQDRGRAQPAGRIAVAHLVNALGLTTGAAALALWAGRAGQDRSVQVVIVAVGATCVLLVAGHAVLDRTGRSRRPAA